MKKRFDVQYPKQTVTVRDSLTLAQVVFSRRPERVIVVCEETSEVIEELDGRLRRVWSVEEPQVLTVTAVAGGVRLATADTTVDLDACEAALLCLRLAAGQSFGAAGVNVSCGETQVTVTLRGVDTVFLTPGQTRAAQRALHAVVGETREGQAAWRAARGPEGSWERKVPSPFARREPVNRGYLFDVR
ncbi:hypothetical protein [Deinococcus sp. PEB2-63]